MLMRLHMLKLSVGKGRQVINQFCLWREQSTTLTLQCMATERVGYVLYRALVRKVLAPLEPSRLQWYPYSKSTIVCSGHSILIKLVSLFILDLIIERFHYIQVHYNIIIVAYEYIHGHSLVMNIICRCC